jgi:hypothetical protein
VVVRVDMVSELMERRCAWCGHWLGLKSGGPLGETTHFKRQTPAELWLEKA